MSVDGSRHVFVSYVSEDGDAVDALCRVLEAAQIPYFRDRKSLGPGDEWKRKIRDAIRDGSMVFLACFSWQSRARDKSYMNEELTLAVEEFRRLAPGRTWLIPVRLDDGPIPDWDLGAGRTLGDLNHVDLFGEGYAAQAASLVTTIHRVMGDKRMTPAATLDAVEHATSANRVDLLRRMTKEMLLDPTEQIRLDDLVAQEARRVLATLNSPDGVAGTLGGGGEDQVVRICEVATDVWEVTKPFIASLQIAARWGAVDRLTPWTSAIRSFARTARKPESGGSALRGLRHLPVITSVVTVAVTAVAARRWESLKALVADQRVRVPGDERQIPMLEASEPWDMFRSGDWAPNVLTRSGRDGISFVDALELYTSRATGKYYTPVGEWLHDLLRPLFAEQLPDDEEFSSTLDQAEVMVGAIAQDAIDAELGPQNSGSSLRRSRWFLRATYRSRHGRSPIADLRDELNAEGTSWAPLAAGLFAGSEARAASAIEAYGETFDEVRRHHLW